MQFVCEWETTFWPRLFLIFTLRTATIGEGLLLALSIFLNLCAIAREVRFVRICRRTYYIATKLGRFWFAIRTLDRA
jgi:hypothetical protein